MTEKQRQIYRLGQVYGHICEKHGHWSSPAHDQTATLRPLVGVTAALMAALKAQAVALNDPYIEPRMASIDPEFGHEPINLNDQGVFTLGKMQIHRTPKALIDMTGMTQAVLAEQLGVKPLTVSRWYRGETPLPERARFELEEIILQK